MSTEANPSAGSAQHGATGACLIARPGWIRRFDCWAASYDASQLQTVLYGKAHDAVLGYARRYGQHPGRILDVGCGTGRLAERIASAYPQACVVGVDASTGMIKKARGVPAVRCPRFVPALAERLPFADAVFDLVVSTLSLSHWRDQAAGLAEVSRVMVHSAILLAADVLPARPSRSIKAKALCRGPELTRGLPELITASGLRVRHVEPIRSVAIVADAALIAAEKPR